MIDTGIDMRVKLQDVVSSQLPEFILSESPLTDDFLRQYYVSQEFQSGTMDYAANLDQYLDLNILTKEALVGDFFLTEPVSAEDTVVHVNTTKSFPNHWGLLKVGDEIMTYTGLTTNTFTGVVRGFSGITSYHSDVDPNELVFQQSKAAPHAEDATVQNLSTLFLREFYEKTKLTFAPGFENLDFNADVNVGTWVRNARSFYQSKGSAESFEILFRVLYGDDPTVLDLEQFLIKPSQAEFTRIDVAVAIPVSGNPKDLQGKTVFQSDTVDVFGAVSQIEPFFRDGRLYYKISFFVAPDEVGDERKLFTVPAITKAQRGWKQGDTTVTVDSTIGFRENGRFITADGTEFTYEDRTVNQFLGVECTDPLKEIAITDEIIDNITIVGQGLDGEEVVLRLTGVLNELNFIDEVPFSSVGEKIFVDSLGQNILGPEATDKDLTYSQIIANSLVYNTSVRFEVLLVDGAEFIVKAPYLDKSCIQIGDTVDILPRGSQDAYVRNRLVTNVNFATSTITVDDSFGVPTNVPIDIRRNLKYAKSKNVPIEYGNDSVLSNVLNLYDAIEYDESFYVATNSLPSYEMDVNIVESIIVGISTLNFEGYNSFEQTYSTLIFDGPVNFYTGDLVSYKVLPGIGTTAIYPICPEGEYFVEVLSDDRKVRLYLSQSFIGGDNFVPLTANSEAGEHIFTLERQKEREVLAQNSYRQIPITGLRQNISIDREPTEVDPGKIAILTNGVDIISYRSPDKVFLGPLVAVDPIAKGEGYSVTSPPEVTVDPVDIQVSNNPTNIPAETVAKLTPVIKGKLEQVLVDPQEFSIDKTYSITVTGGNSTGASAIPVVEKRSRQIPFDSRLDIFGGGINPIEETIQFVVEHNLDKGQAIVYNNRNTSSIGIAPFDGPPTSGGATLSNGGVYYAEPVNNLTIRLYPSREDVFAGLNTIGFSTNLNGYGFQEFDTLATDRIIAANIIEDGGFFWNRTLNTQPSNIFTAYDEVRYPNHGFKTGELITYATTGTVISGLSTEDQYYVVADTEDAFKLCNAGVGGTSDFNYNRLEYVNFETSGVGTQTFAYPEIQVNVNVAFGSTISGIITATPVIRGEIDQIYVDDGGFYGTDIINFEKNPLLSISKGSGARINAIVVEGKIAGLQILSKGNDYPDNPEVVITDTSGAGLGGLVRPIVVNGRIEDLIIIDPGFGYGTFTTKIEVVDPSKGAILKPRIRPLEVNLTERFGFETLVGNTYAITSYDKTIREDVYGDLGLIHSPIIGWSRDGNPIYGGFGYEVAEDPNSDIVAMQTSYELDASDVEGRPSLVTYPAGFFVEDYKYTGDGDLDEYNGRYCRTPEFPNGVYAYFAGISTDPLSPSRPPQFPYFIGPKYRDSPLSNSGDISFDDLDINNNPIYRNTFPYYVGSPVAGSEFLVQSYLSDNQEAKVTAINNGSVNGVVVVSEGEGYKVGDIPVFDTAEDTVNSVVTEITGREVVSIGSSIVSYSQGVTKLIRLDSSTVRVYVEPNHDYITDDIIVISGVSSDISNIAGPNRIKVDESQMTLFSPVAPLLPPLSEGIIDIFVNSITDNVSVGSSLVIESDENQFEIVKVLNIFPENKGFRVQRFDEYLVESPSGSPVRVLPNYFDIQKKTLPFDSELDTLYYFNPFQTLGVGLTEGFGIPRTYPIGDVNYQLSVPTKSIFAPSQKFVNNEPVIIEKAPVDSNIQYVDNNGDIRTLPSPNVGVYTGLFYVATLSKDLIGIKTTADSEPVSFTSDGTDSALYSIRSLRRSESAQLDRINAVVTTAAPHGLLSGDQVDVSVTSNRTSGIGTAEAVKVEFDEVSQSLIVDPEFAQPLDVNIQKNTITIDDHGYKRGSYVLYQNTGSPITGLQTHQKYFVIPFDANTFQLAETFEDIKPGSELPVNLESIGIGSHKFSLVNPPLEIIFNGTLEFNVSSPTLLGKKLEFFYDRGLTEIFENNGVSPNFVVSGISTEGFFDGRKRIEYSEFNPNVIYYGLDIGGYISTADTAAVGNNSLQYRDSTYAERRPVTVTGVSTFTYTLFEKPEIPEYTTLDADLSYNTSSSNTTGGVGRVRVISSGDNYTTLPEFITVDSLLGNAATLRATSDNIGDLTKTEIQNPGWGYSADNTLRPKGKIQTKVEFTNSDFVSSIDIIFGGVGFQQPPNAVLLDAVTREVVDNGVILLEVQSSTISGVDIEVAPTGLSKNLHELYTINNSNGIPILTVDGVDNNTGIVTYTIQTPILGYSIPPFEVGDEVFVENIIRNDTSVAPLNLNSDEYGYRFFEVINVSQTNPIIVTIQYPDSAINNIGIADTFQGAFSSLVNKNIYPQFQVNQGTAIFIVGERLSIFDEQGNLIETDLIVEESNTNFFKVRGNYDILVGSVLKGNVSGVIKTVTVITSNECRFEVNSTSRIDTGWTNNIGFLNDDQQVTPNNDYYQNLSYSIQSDETFEEWIGPVNRLVHPTGLKNFADTRVEGIGSIGLGVTSKSYDTITLDIIGLTDIAETPLRVDRVNVFDLGYDDEVNNNRSNAVRFNSKTPDKRLTDYFEVKTNRVLMIDDISSQFIDSDNLSFEERYVDFNVISSSWTRGLIMARNPFTDQVQFTEVVGLTYNNNAFTMQKASVSDNYEGYGVFEARALQSTEYNFRFTPFDQRNEDFDIDFKLLTNKFIFEDDADLRLGYVELGGDTINVPSGDTSQVYRGSDSSVDGAFLYVEVIDINGKPSYFEVYSFILGSDTYIATYGFNSTPYDNYNEADIGIFASRISGGRLTVDFTNNDPNIVSLTIKSTEYRPTAVGIQTYRFKRPSLGEGEEESLILESTSASGLSNSAFIDLATFNVERFQAVRSVYYISMPNELGALHQVMSINSNDNTYTDEYPFLTEGDGVPGPGIGTFGAVINGDDWILRFYPDAGLPALQTLDILGYHEAFYRTYDTVNYRNLPLVYAQTEENYYLDRYIAPLGQRTNVTQFELKHGGVPIYQKTFEPNEVITPLFAGATELSLFNIPDHFFSPAEELYYFPGASLPGAPSAPIGIVTTVNYAGVTTDKMPDRVWCIKRDLNRFQLAATEQDAKNGDFIVVTDFGVGNAHRIGMLKRLEKSMITIDGVLQSPLTSANVDFTLDSNPGPENPFMVLTGIGTIKAGDILRVNDELIILDNVGFATSPSGPILNEGSFPLIEVQRGTLGSIATSHTAGSTMSLYRGSYNIIESDIFFTEAPSGKGAFAINESNLVEINSTFQGRTFLQKEYDEIVVFDDISDQFNGIENVFTLTSMGSTVGLGTSSGAIENGSGVLLINDVYQTPTTDNNEGNDYFYIYDEQVGINSVVFTGVTSTNGQRVESQFDINQNQIPRGGLPVSFGSTPGLGYAPLAGAVLEPVVSAGVIVGVNTMDSIGVTTGVRYADYDKELGKLTVSLTGAPVTAPIAITGATYLNDAGTLLVTSSVPLASAGIERGDVIVLSGLQFTCNAGTKSYPDKNDTFVVDTITGNNSFSVAVDVSNIEHNYVSGGTYQKFEPFIFGREGKDPRFAFLQGLNFNCVDSTTITNISNAAYDNVTGIVTVTTSTPSGADVGKKVQLQNMVFSCTFGSSLYPRPAVEGTEFTILNVNSSTEFEVEVGVSTLVHTYVSGGTANVGVTTTVYPENNDYFAVEERLTDARYVLDVGISSISHEYTGGGTVGQFTVNDAGSGYRGPFVSIAVTEPGHTGSPAEIRGVPGPGGELSIVVVDGGTGYVDPIVTAPDPDYFNLPVKGVFRRSTGFGTETGVNLRVTCDVSAATTTAVGRSEYFEVANWEITNQGYSFQPGDIVEVVGLVTAKGLSQPIEPFQLTVTDTFTDNFSAWNFGETDYLDSIKPLQNGVRTRFPIFYKGSLFSFEQDLQDEDSAAIQMDALLLIYVNTVLQLPGLNYNFSGGTSFEFTKAPSPQDDIDVYFYRGKRGTDSDIVVDVDESIKPGDDIQVFQNDAIEGTKTQNIRSVTEIAASDTVRTNIYFGVGDLETIKPRPVAWDKQKRDTFIYGEPVFMTRDSLEPIIKPTGSIIRSVSDVDTTIYVDNADLFEYEELPGQQFPNLKARIYDRDDFVPAVLEAVINANGELDSVTIIEGGSGYPNNATIIVAPPNHPDGTRAQVQAFFFGGSLQPGSITVINPGSGYSQSSPPPVYTDTYAFRYEDLKKIGAVNGFAGTISSIGISPIPATPGLQTIRFYIDVLPDRYDPTEISELGPRDSFVISHTVVGNGVETRGQTFADVVGIGLSFLDAVYEVKDQSFIGLTGWVDANVSGSTDLTGITISGQALGTFSWGRLDQVERELPTEGALSFPVDGKTYTPDLDNYPSVIRRNEGLRNEGGLAKQLKGI